MPRPGSYEDFARWQSRRQRGSYEDFRRWAGLAEPEPAKSSMLPAVFAPIRDTVGGVLDVTGAGAGAVAGAAAAALGSDAYGRVLTEKYAERENRRLAEGETPGVFREALSRLTLAPKVGEVLTADWNPEGVGGEAAKNTVSLLATLATDPATYTPKGIASIAAASKRARAAEIAKDFIGPAQRLSVPGAIGEALEGTLGSVIPAAIYAPDIVQGVGAGAKGAYESAQKGEYGAAAAQSAQAMLMAGLTYLMGKGLIHEKDAWKTLRAHETGHVAPEDIEPTIPQRTPAVEQSLNEDVPAVFRQEAPAAPERVFYGREDGTVIEGQPGTYPRTFYVGETGQARAGEVDQVPPPTAAELAEPMPAVGAVDELPDALTYTPSRFGAPPVDEYVPPVFQPVPERAPRAKKAAPAEPPPSKGPGRDKITEELDRLAEIERTTKDPKERAWARRTIKRIEDEYKPEAPKQKAEAPAPEPEKPAAPAPTPKAEPDYSTPEAVEAAFDDASKTLNADLKKGNIDKEDFAAYMEREVEKRRQRLNAIEAKKSKVEEPSTTAPKEEKPAAETKPEAAPKPGTLEPDDPMAALQDEIDDLSRQGYRARELAAKYGVPESEIRRARRATVEEVKEGAAKRFAKPEGEGGAPTTPKAPRTAKVAPESTPAPPTPQELKDSVEAFLRGKESVTEGELRDHLKSKGLSTIGKKGVEHSPVKKALKQLEDLGVFTKGEGKTRIPRADLREAKPNEPATSAERPADTTGGRSDSVPDSPLVGTEHVNAKGVRYRVERVFTEKVKTGKGVKEVEKVEVRQLGGAETVKKEFAPSTTVMDRESFDTLLKPAGPAPKPQPGELPSTTVKPETEGPAGPGPIQEKPDPKYEANKQYFVDQNGELLPEIKKGVDATARSLAVKLRIPFEDARQWAIDGVHDAIRTYDAEKVAEPVAPTVVREGLIKKGKPGGKVDPVAHAKRAADRNIYKLYTEGKQIMGSASTASRARLIRANADDLRAELKREPTAEEIAARVREVSPEMAQLQPSTVKKALRMSQESLDADEAVAGEAKLRDESRSPEVVAQQQERVRKLKGITEAAIDKHTANQPEWVQSFFKDTLLNDDPMKAKEASEIAAKAAEAGLIGKKEKRGEAALSNIKRAIREDIEKAIKEDKDLRAFWRASKQTPNDIPEAANIGPATMAVNGNWVAPVKNSEAVVLQSDDISDAYSRQIAESPEMGRIARIFQRMDEKIRKVSGSDSKFHGFLLTRGITGFHSSIGVGDKRIYLNPIDHARAILKAFLPVDGRPGELANRLVGTMIHEHIHNQFHETGENTVRHGDEFWEAYGKLYDKLVEDGSYSAMRNDIMQALESNDFYLYKWLAGQSAEVPKHGTEPRKIAPIRDAGEAGSAAAARGSQAAGREAVAGAEGRPGSEEAVRASDTEQAQGVADIARLRERDASTTGSPDPKRFSRAVDLQLGKDPDVRAALKMFTDATLKDMDPDRLMEMAPKISSRLTADVLKKAMDAWEDPDAYIREHPEAAEGYKSAKKAERTGEPQVPGRAKPGGDPDIALNLLRLDIDPDLKQRMQVFYHVLEPLQLRAEKKPWVSETVLLSQLGKYRNNKDLVNHIKKYGVTEEDLTLLRMVDVFNQAELRNHKIRTMQLQSLIDEGNKSPALVTEHQRAMKELGVRAAINAQLALDLSGEKTKLGRMLSALRRPVDGWEPHMQQASEWSKFLYALEEQGVQKPIRDQLWNLLKSSEPHALEEFQAVLRKALQYKFWDKFAEYYTAGLVSGIPTKLANFSSNAMFRGLRDIENTFAVGIDWTRHKLTGAERTRYIGEMSAWTSGYMAQWSQAMKNWQQAHMEIATMKPLSKKPGFSFVGGTALDVAKGTGAIGGRIGEVVRLGYKSMEADDNFFKHIAGAGELYRRLYRQGRMNNLTHEQALTAMHSQVDAIMKADADGALDQLLLKNKDLKNILEAVDKAARSDTFQGALQGTVMKEIAHKVQLLTNIHPSMKIFVPFVRTPANILSETWKRTPMGLINVLRKKNSMEAGEFAEELSKSLVGTVAAANLAFIAYTQAVSDSPALQITGQGPLDPRIQAELKATGWQPYSFKIGNRYVPYQRYEPFSSILGMAADMAEAVKNGDVETPKKFAMRMASSAAKNLTNKTFLAGISNIVEAWHEPERNFEFFIEQLEQSIVPLSGLTRSVARAVDPVYREVDWTTAPFAAVPGASKLLSPQYAPTGEERKRPGSAFERAVSPGPTSAEDDTPRGRLLRQMADIGFSPRIDDQIRSKKFGKVDLTDDEVAKLARARTLANKRLESIIDDPRFQALPDNDEDPRAFGGRKTKRDMLEKVHRKYYQAALRSIYQDIGRRAIEQHRSQS